MQVVVWNSDARCKPELEVEIEIVTSELDVPGFFHARFASELEVELEIIDGLDVPAVCVAQFDDRLEIELVDEEHEWVGGDEVVALDDYTVYDEPPRGYAEAFRLAV